MSLINVSGLTFAYPGSYDDVFQNVSFQIDTDWKLGFIGRNGRGKTTFLKLLMGEYEYAGSISASVHFDYFPFPVEDKSRPAGEVVLSISRAEEWRILKELSAMNMEEELLRRPFHTLSGGEQTRLLLIALFLKENNFLLIDEPTNHLDMEGRRTLAAYLKNKKSFILVSHDRTFLDTAVDHVLSINRANIEVQRGNFSSWRQNMEYALSHELAENERLQSDISRLGSAMRRTAGWSDRVEKSKYGEGGVDRGYIGAKSAKMMKRAKAIEGRRQKAVEEKSALLKNVEQAEPLKLPSLSYRAKRCLFAEELSVDYGAGPVFQNLTFTLSEGERIALFSRNGSGKSSLMKLIMGEDIPHAGSLRTGAGLLFSYVPQDTSFLSGGTKEFVAESASPRRCLKPSSGSWIFLTQFEKDSPGAFGRAEEKSAHCKEPVPASPRVPVGRTLELHRRAFENPDRGTAVVPPAHHDLCGARRSFCEQRGHPRPLPVNVKKSRPFGLLLVVHVRFCHKPTFFTMDLSV